jgi:DNA adenine methylase
MRLPQPFQYQGSKRKLAPQILALLPSEVGRLVEPFAGSAALSIAAAAEGRAATFWLNDANAPLAALVEAIIEQPEPVAEAYRALWRDRDELTADYYNSVRDRFNESQDPHLLLYLIARCVKGAVRYNASGAFNQSPDNRRLGVQPSTLRRNVLAISALLRGRTRVTAQAYQAVLAEVTPRDLVYMDPPYQGVSTGRDPRYAASIDSEEFVEALADLVDRDIPFALSYDGRTGDKRYGEALPEELGLRRLELDAGLSTQATLLGDRARTVEALYLSPALAAPSGTASDSAKAKGQQLSLLHA